MANLLVSVSLVAALACTCPGAATAETPAPRPKKIDILIGFDSGGLYDVQARLVARHLGAHLAGQPSIVPQNMPGAGGVKMATFLADIAAKDGSVIGTIPSAFPFMQAVRMPEIKFDVGRFQWIGSISPLVGTISVASRSGVADIEGARKKELTMGASGVGGDSYTMAAMFNAFAGTRFKIVTGYKGGNDINLAIERGELDGRYNFWTSWKSTRPDWLSSGYLQHLAYFGPRPPELKDVPSIFDVLMDPADSAAVDLIISGNKLGTPLAAPAGVPRVLVDELRTAFHRMMSDPRFRDEADRLKLELDEVSWRDIQKIVDDCLRAPREVAERAAALLPKR